jgi:hypothetical protein
VLRAYMNVWRKGDDTDVRAYVKRERTARCVRAQANGRTRVHFNARSLIHSHVCTHVHYERTFAYILTVNPPPTYSENGGVRGFW